MTFCSVISLGRLTFDSFVFLEALAERGHHASRPKLPWAQTTVTCLGPEMSQRARKLTPKFCPSFSPNQNSSFVNLQGQLATAAHGWLFLLPLRNFYMPSSQMLLTTHFPALGGRDCL